MENDSTSRKPEDQAEPQGRRVAVAGATGLIGSELLRLLLEDPSVAEVHAIGRRLPDLSHPKLIGHVVDFSAMPALPSLDEVYLALGTTIKVAGSRAAFRSVDFEASLAVAKAAAAAGAQRCGVVSAMGAQARSGIFYNRVKGELEDALAALSFEALVIARPSLLTGNRTALGQPSRRAERFGQILSPFFEILLPANWSPVPAASVARTLARRVPEAHGREVLLSGKIREIGRPS